MNVPHSGLIAFVYRNLLYRDPAPDDVLAWSAEIEGGLSCDAFLSLVAGSDEALSAADKIRDEALSTIEKLFYRALGRHPSPEIVAEWQSQLPSRSIASFVDEILESPETRRRFERPAPHLVDDAISFIYRHGLGRQPTAADLLLWSRELEEGLSFVHVLNEILISDEGRRRSALVDQPPSAEAIAFVYRYALGRAASDEDLRIWTQHLAGGFPFERFVLDMLASDEAGRRARPLDGPQLEKAITFAYLHTLGRAPADSDIRLWRDHLREGLPFERFLLDLLASEEAETHGSASASTQTLSDASFIAYLYEVCLGRGALASELELWKRRIYEKGYRRKDLALWFVETAIGEDKRQADAGRQHDGGTVPIMGTGRFLNAAIWASRAEDIRLGRNTAQAAPLSAPYVVRPHTIRVSAIASLYKGGRYIRRFLDNMVQQSLGENFELIVIDAASPDGEGEVIAEYQKVWPNIRYERMNYRIGIYDAWNVGIGLARGDYLTNTNLDDLRRRDSLELQAETLDAVAFADVVYQDFFYSLAPDLTFEQVEAYGFKSSLPLVTANNLLAFNSPHNAPMWRRRLHSEVGLFDTALKSAGDHEFWLRCLQAEKVFYKINTPHVVYYLNPDGISTRPGTSGVSEGQQIQRRYGRKLISPDLYLDREALTAKLETTSGGLTDEFEESSTYERIQRLILSLVDGSDPRRSPDLAR